MAMLIKGVVQGVLPSMKNSRSLFRSRATGKPIIVKSEKARAYQNVTAALQLKPAQLQKAANIKLPILDEVVLTLNIYYPDHRRDLDGELFCDLLQKFGVINNDRQIRKKVFTKFFDKLNPRVEWQLEKFSKKDKD